MKKYGTSAKNVVCGNRGEEKGMQGSGPMRNGRLLNSREDGRYRERQ